MKTNPENTCQTALDVLLGRMEHDDFSQAELESMCRQFPDCSEQLRSTYAMWESMDEMTVPEPSPAMHTGFYKMLNEVQEKEAKKGQALLRFDWWTWNGFSLKWAVIAGVFLLGVFSGSFFNGENSGAELVDMDEKYRRAADDSYVRLTSSNSVTERLQGVQMAKQMEQLDDRIIEALNQTLLHDRNVNVRLSAIETMLHFSDDPKVRENLIRAIPHQTSPLVQMTLAEVMIALKDKRAVEEIQELLHNQKLELEVQMKMEETIETLL